MSMVQNRWFIGVLLPDELSNEISQIQHDLIDEETMLKPLVPHITLVHPNPLMELSPIYFIPVAKQATDSLLPCTVQLESVGMFNNNVLYIKVISSELTDIHNALVSALPPKIQAQYFVGNTFTAHVTIAQTRGRNAFDDNFIKKVKSQIEPLLPATFIVSHLTRYEWQGSRVYNVKDL